MFSVSSNYFKSLLHSYEVADFVNFNVPGEHYSHVTDHFTSSWAFSGRVALESVIKSGGVEGKLGWCLGQNIKTWECWCAYTTVVQKTKSVPAKGMRKVCVSLNMGNISHPLLQINKLKWHLCFLIAPAPTDTSAWASVDPRFASTDLVPSSGALCSPARLSCVEEWEDREGN